jgi:hypothetical protein
MLLDFVYNSLRNLLLNFTFNFLLAISQDGIHLSLSFSDFEILLLVQFSILLFLHFCASQPTSSFCLHVLSSQLRALSVGL